MTVNIGDLGATQEIGWTDTVFKRNGADAAELPSTIVVGSGGTGTVTTDTNQDLALAPNGSGIVDCQSVFTHPGTFAEIYCAGASATQTTNATPDTFDTVTGFTTDGESNDCTAAAASDKITVTRAGTYAVNFNCSFTGSSGITYTLQLYNLTDATAITKCTCVRLISTGTDAGSAGFSGIVAIGASKDIVVQVAATTPGSRDFIPSDMNLSLHRIGD